MTLKLTILILHAWLSAYYPTVEVKSKLERLDQPDPASGLYGSCIAATKDHLLIGAPAGSESSAGRSNGRVVAFKRTDSGWVFQQGIGIDEHEDTDHFGISVSLDGLKAVVGASNAERTGLSSGAAFVFRFTGSKWERTCKLLAPIETERRSFGACVEICGDHCFVSSQSLEAGTASVVHVFRIVDSDGVYVTTLRSSQPRKGEEFGVAMTAAEGKVYITAPNSNGGRTFQYGLDQGTWALQSVIELVDEEGRRRCGASISAEAGIVVIGTPAIDLRDLGRVSVHHMQDGEWKQACILEAPDANGRFGMSCAIHHGSILVGAPGMSFVGGNFGGVWQFTLLPDKTMQKRDLIDPPAFGLPYAFGLDVCYAGIDIVIGSPGFRREHGVAMGHAFFCSPTDQR